MPQSVLAFFMVDCLRFLSDTNTRDLYAYSVLKTWKCAIARYLSAILPDEIFGCDTSFISCFSHIEERFCDVDFCSISKVVAIA